jgi:hypothetical protein
VDLRTRTPATPDVPDARPYVSVVVCGQKPDYGGNFAGRMQNFIDVLFALAARRRARFELVLVEWNRPLASPPLESVLEWPESLPFPVRVIEVPPDVHRRLPKAEQMAFFEYTAKNVGIRRAHGDFVLATNPDNMFEPAVVNVLAGHKLSADSFYRVDRFDIRSPIPDGTVEERLAYCRANIWRINTLGRSVVFEHPPRRWAARPRLLQRAVSHSAVELPDRSAPESWIHCNGAGDFLLMHRERWHDLRGYPELPSSGMLDGYGCVMATAAGMTQRLLRGWCRIYHQEHPRAAEWAMGETPHHSVPYEQFLRDAGEMLAAGRPKIFNSVHWGLADVELVERRPNETVPCT